LWFVDVADNDFITSAKLQCEIPSGGIGLIGVATLGNDVFVARRNAKIDVYDVVTSTLRQSMSLSGFVYESDDGYEEYYPQCMAACDFHKCFYFSCQSSCRSAFVLKASLSRNTDSVGSFESHLAVTTWSTKAHNVYDNVYCVSVNKNHNVLVASVNTYEGLPVVQEYTTDGVVVQQVNLPPDITHIRQVIQLPNGFYGVIHQGQCRHYSVVDSTRHVVKCLEAEAAFNVKSNDTGRPNRARSGRKGQMQLKLSTPVGLTVTRSGTVFIADHNSNKILVVRDSGSTLTAEWLPDTVCGTLSKVSCVYFDDAKNRLYIGEEGGRVLCCGMQL